MRDPETADGEGKLSAPEAGRPGLRAVPPLEVDSSSAADAGQGAPVSRAPSASASRGFLSGDLVQPGRDESIPGFEFRRELRRRAHVDALVDAVLEEAALEQEATPAGRDWGWLIVVAAVLAAGLVGARFWPRGPVPNDRRPAAEAPRALPSTVAVAGAPSAAPPTTPAPVALEKSGSAQAPTEPSVAALLATAQEYAAHNDWTTPAGRCALDVYREVLRREPGHPDAVAGIASVVEFFVRRGVELCASGDTAGARTRYAKARRVLDTAGVAAGLPDVERRRQEIAAAVAELPGGEIR